MCSLARRRGEGLADHFPLARLVVESIPALELHGVDTHLGWFLLVRFGHTPSVAPGGNFRAIL